ncbi:putative selenium-dependent hydroxylase accessory protein YqeC [Carpediemonas membranifera]|uniref:Putative selenium-dependent hydroxylase accessory protein YqeC n=1 Tax=Carpediemonas membranifera TaxID=201153 RepID=A0A8J6AUW7_9EUKA|nr:putative selenium-dependent hydroxylase accessory protein YqeC [Carpediemonas membranifera]|eukprot:KAG9392175.1 putative selenium-dependent hydroxylase accessory protein YqeC [Carpediemonas membranifera]
MEIPTKKGTIISLVGAGGKTHLAYLLAKKAATEGLRVVITTTTRLQPPSEDHIAVHDSRIPVVIAHTLSEFSALCTLEPGDQVLLTSKKDKELERLIGIPTIMPRDLITNGLADIVICEADGARLLPLKMYAPHEPVPAIGTTDLITVAGLDAVNTVISDATVFRPELVRGAAKADTLHPSAFARVVRALDEGAAVHAPGAVRYVVLNKLDTVGADVVREVCAELPDALLSSFKRDGLVFDMCRNFAMD